MYRSQRVAVYVAASLMGGLAMVACDAEPEDTQTRRDAIVNGQPATPALTGHVRVTFKDHTDARGGSGTLVKPDVVLTAGHVLSDSNCPAVSNVNGNTWRTCSFVPRTHKVQKFDYGTDIGGLTAKQVFVHPQFVPDHPLSGDVDVALLKLSPLDPGETAFTDTYNYNKSLYTGTALSLKNGPDLRLFGFGCESPSWSTCMLPSSTGSGKLHYADYQAVDIRNGNYYTRPLASAFGFPGDSGGPFMTDGSDTEIAAVMKAVVTDVVISQVFGAAHTPGTPYTHDFVELLNLGPIPQDLNGWSLQYTTATGGTWVTQNLSGNIPPRSYYLIRLAAGTAGGTSLPTPNATGVIDLGPTAGKVALVRHTAALTGSCPTSSPWLEDLVGYGATANCYEGSNPAPAPGTTTAAVRKLSGCQDTNDNATNFTAAAPTPRNTASPVASCNWGISVPAERFRDWYNEVLDPKTLLSSNEVLGVVDTIPDAVFLKRGYVSPFGGTWFSIKILWSHGGSLELPTPFPDEVPSKVAFALGDFNGNGIPDVVGHINHQPFYWTTNWLTTVSSQSLSLVNLDSSGCASTGGVCYDYDYFNVADYDGDGIDDLEAVNLANGWVDIYSGTSGGGLQAGSQYGSFLSPLGTDGKFLTVTGVGLATINFPAFKAGVDVPATQANFDVQIFDGDMGATNDTNGGGRTCYRLFADPEQDNAPPLNSSGQPIYIVNVDDSFFPDHAWKSLYKGPNVPAALAPNGEYYLYTLSVELVSGTCAAPTSNNLATLNAFALRSNGELSYNWDGRLQFIGRDAAGDFVPVHSGVRRDTTYDGVFDLPVLLAPYTESARFTEADADDLDDAAEQAGLWGPWDVQAPGQAVGANSAIRYEVFGWNPNSAPFSLGSAANPSGQYGPTGAQDREERVFQTYNHDYGLWRWSDVMTENNVHLWFPQDGTLEGQYYFIDARLFRGDKGLHGSSAQTASSWAGSPPAVIDQYLMILLGTGRNVVRVSGASRAVDILTESHSPCGEPRPHGELLALMAELLAAKLNVSHAATLGENLDGAKIYGSVRSVADAIAIGDHSLVTCTPSASARASMAASASVLRAVNRRFVDNRWD